MEVEFDSSGTTEGLAKVITRFARQPAIRAAIVLGADDNAWSIDTLDPVIRDSAIPLLGGVFPRIAFDGKSHERGTLVVGLEHLPDTGVIRGLSDPDADFESRIASVTDDWSPGQSESTYMIVLDGLASRIGDLVEGLFFTLGLEHNFIGGGAGSLSFEQSPCIITPQGLCEDAALIVRLSLSSSIGVTHGWQAISDTFTVTESEGNTVKTIEWEPAGDLYAREVERHSGVRPTHDAFFSIAKSYPLGIARFGGELVVRDPLMMSNDGELICVGEVPSGCRIRLLNGDTETLIAAAADARNEALEACRSSNVGGSILFDCISRVLFLDNDLERELRALGGNDRILGAFTLGEVANSGRGHLDFLNKSTVYAVLGP